MIDWKKPIEAVRKSDGLIFPVRFNCRDDKFFYTHETPNDDETNSVWREDGTDFCSHDKWYIRNKQDENVIDWTKPLELVDGRKVKLKYEEPRQGNDRDVYVEGDGSSRTYNSDGSHFFGKLPNIRNRAEPATDYRAAMGYDLDARDIIRALLQYSTPMSGLLGVIAREAGERYIND